MDVISKHISLTAWGRLYGFGKATTSRLHRTGKLPPELRIEQLPNGRYYVVAPPRNDARCVVGCAFRDLKMTERTPRLLISPWHWPG